VIVPKGTGAPLRLRLWQTEPVGSMLDPDPPPSWPAGCAEPDLPPEIEPFSFVSVALLDHVAARLMPAATRQRRSLRPVRVGPGCAPAGVRDRHLHGDDSRRFGWHPRWRDRASDPA